MIIVLWSRMGTPLPTDKYQKANGEPYWSGTEWEFEDALRAARDEGKPTILVYRRKEIPHAPITLTEEEMRDRRLQWTRVEAFFAQFKASDGTLSGGTHHYQSPTEFAELLSQHLQAVLRQSLDEARPTDSILPTTSQIIATKGLDSLPHRWIYTNHSESAVNWRPVHESAGASIRRIVIENYSAHVASPGAIAAPLHATGSDIFRVQAKNSPTTILLKRFRHQPSDAELSALIDLQEGVAKAAIFPTGEFLSPLITDSGRKWVRQDNHVIIACRFVTGADTGLVTHFRGSDCREIESVGRSLGKLNTYLRIAQDAPAQERSTAEKVVFRPTLVQWQEVKRELEREAFLDTRSRYLAKAEQTFLCSVRDEVQPMLETLTEAEPRPFTLNDLHPHNVFVSNGECVLIFDYTIGDEWPETATASFALHRMCREYVRRIIRSARSFRDVGALCQRERDLIAESATRFLKGYIKERPIEVADLVIRNGAQWAKAINFVKLVNNVAFEIYDIADKFNRTEEQHYAEIVKFISYLKELELFDAVFKQGLTV